MSKEDNPQDAGLGQRPNGADDQYITKTVSEEKPLPSASPKLATAYTGAGFYADLE